MMKPFHLLWTKKSLVLDAVLKEKIDAPYSCQGGVCSSCIARITAGKAEMVKNQILTDGGSGRGAYFNLSGASINPNFEGGL